MRSTNLSPETRFARPNTHSTSLGLAARVGAVLMLAGLLVSGVYWSSAASTSKKQSHQQRSTFVSQKAKTPQTGGKLVGSSSLTLGSYIHPFMLPQGPPPPGSPYPIAIYESDCTTPKTVFNLQDTDKTVCAKVTGGAPTGFRLIWSNANNVAVQDVAVGTGQSTFTLTGGSSLGDWRVIAFEPFGGAVYTVEPFTVVDSGNPEADLTISKSLLSDNASSGGQILYSIQVTNLGPSDAASVQVTDNVPNATTFSSFDPVSGANFGCANVSGDVTCTIANLARGESAIFLASYDVTGGPGIAISNTATISSTTPDPNSLNNSSTAVMTITAPTAEECNLTCPADVVVTANTTDAGQPGAFVTYGAASGSGNCGAISNTPASGSFFTVGVHPVSSNSELGGSCTFTVTVLGTNPPTISCPADVTVNLASGETQATLTEPQIGTPSINASGGGTLTFARSDDVPATFDENGNVITPAVVHSLTDPYEIGTTGILWTVTDAGGRTATCSQRIIVNGNCASDTQTPTITAPADITVSTGPDNTGCTAVLEELGEPNAHDDCSVVVTLSGVPAGNAFPVGATTVTYTATDPSGHTATDTQLVTVIDNTPPIIVAPPNATYVCPSEVPAANPSQAHGDNPNLPDGGPPTDNCGTPTVTVGQTSSGAGSIANPLIITRTFTATDSHGNSASAVQTITVADGIAPTITLNGADPQYVECHTSYPELGATAHDNCSADFAATPSGTVNVNTPGTYTVTYNANDAAGNAATPVTRTVIVQDTTAPIITTNGQTLSMWPPNHKYQTFQVTNFVTAASDSCATSLGINDVVIEKVTSDEIENGNGDGNTMNDIVISANCKSVQLRSEREGDGNGRVYTITFRLRDASGNTTRVTAKVVVPHNPGETAIDGGVHYTVNSSCP